MTYQSGHDTILFGTSAARNGFTAVPVAAGFNEWPANGAPGTGTLVFNKQPCRITRAGVITEAIANIIAGADGWRIHTTNDPDWQSIAAFVQDQTAAWRVDNVLAPMDYPFAQGESLTMEIDNNNNAQGDWGIVCLDMNGQAKVHGAPPGNIPKDAQWVEFDSATNSVADTVTRTGLTPVSWVADRDAVYRVYAARVQAATGVAFRLVSLSSEDRPGGPISDTMIAGDAVYYTPFAVEVNGLQGFWGDILSAGAEASVWHLLIARVK